MIGKWYDSLSEKEEQRLGKILSYSKELAEVYVAKEVLFEWYNLSNESNYYCRLIKLLE